MNGSLLVKKTQAMYVMCWIWEFALTFRIENLFHTQISAQTTGDWYEKDFLQRVYSWACAFSGSLHRIRML